MFITKVQLELDVLFYDLILECVNIVPHDVHVILEQFLQSPLRSNYFINSNKPLLSLPEMLLDSAKLCDNTSLTNFPLVLHEQYLLVDILEGT